MAMYGPCSMWASLAAVEALLESAKINVAATHGAIADAPELKACARFRRAEALCSGPRIETYGLADVCKAQTLVASTKIAVKVRGKLT